jgi:hypothetical protein
MHQVDVIPSESVADDLHFALHHVSNLAEKLWHRGTPPHGIRLGVRAVELWLGGQTAYRLAKGLGGNRPCCDVDAADTRLLFDHHRAFAQLRGLNRCPLSRWTTANTNQIVLVAWRHLSSSHYGSDKTARETTACLPR